MSWRRSSLTRETPLAHQERIDPDCRTLMTDGFLIYAWRWRSLAFKRRSGYVQINLMRLSSAMPLVSSLIAVVRHGIVAIAA